jgi:hypothetical protein
MDHFDVVVAVVDSDDMHEEGDCDLHRHTMYYAPDVRSDKDDVMHEMQCMDLGSGVNNSLLFRGLLLRLG